MEEHPHNNKPNQVAVGRLRACDHRSRHTIRTQTMPVRTQIS